MEADIITFLETTFFPQAIIMHGSRASGHARPHSDWDFILLHERAVALPANGRAEFNGENLEFTHHHLPVVDVLDEFGVKLQNARVVYDPQGVAEAVLAAAHKEYDAGLNWSNDERVGHSLWLCGRIDGMRDTIDQPLLFAKYAADVYSRATNYWYWAKHDRFAQPIYIALEEIKERDPTYFSLLERFVLESDPQQKITTAEQMYRHCFAT